MSITAGEDILASDFINVSVGAGDSGKAPKLNASGELDRSFLTESLKGAMIDDLVAGEAITAGEALIVGDNSGDVAQITQDNNGTQYNHAGTGIWALQSFTTVASGTIITAIQLYTIQFNV